MAYGPLLRSQPELLGMQESVMRYALCDPGSLRAELGIPVDALYLATHVEPVGHVKRTDLEFTWLVNCHE
jgi:hypothetical protein